MKKYSTQQWKTLCIVYIYYICIIFILYLVQFVNVSFIGKICKVQGLRSKIMAFKLFIYNTF